jgi:hypothetical protein
MKENKNIIFSWQSKFPYAESTRKLARKFIQQIPVKEVHLSQPPLFLWPSLQLREVHLPLDLPLAMPYEDPKQTIS